MVTAIALFIEWGASKLPAPDDQGVLDQAAAFEVLQKASDRLVGRLAPLTVVGFEATGYLAVTSLAEENRAFELLHRYETRYARAYARAARSLIAYRKYRQTESDQTPAPTQAKKLPHEPTPLTPPRNAREFQKWQRKMAQRGHTLQATAKPEPKCPR